MRVTRIELIFPTKLSLTVDASRSPAVQVALLRARKRVEACAAKELAQLREAYHLDPPPGCTGS